MFLWLIALFAGVGAIVWGVEAFAEHLGKAERLRWRVHSYWWMCIYCTFPLLTMLASLLLVIGIAGPRKVLTRAHAVALFFAYGVVVFMALRLAA